MGTAIQNKLNTNYTLYYNVLNYFKTIMSNHPTVEVASYGSLEEMDLNQFPAYPVANIDILDTNFGISTTNFTIQLTVVDKVKNKNNESSVSTNEQTIPYYKTDDTVDIHTNTLAVINDLTSYTQRGVSGFEINDDIVCEPFNDRFNNGLAGWQSTFTLTTHNDKNRCLFFLINPSGSGYIISDCITGDEYKAVLNGSGSIGQVFSAPYVFPNAESVTTSYGINCYTIVNTFENSDEFNLVGLPILQFPFSDFGDCPNCLKWIAPQVWGTTFMSWNLQPNTAYKVWSKA
jgi:hypothetical protein